MKRWWWLLVVGAGVAALMGFLVASRLPPTYESEATLLVGPISGDGDTLQAAGQQARNYAAVATTQTIIGPAARALGMSSSAVKSKIKDVTASDVTRLLTIRVRDGDSPRAARIANELARQLVVYSKKTDPRVVTPTEPTTKPATPPAPPPAGLLSIRDPATPATSGIGPSAALIVPLAALAGLLVSLGLAAIVDGLSTVVRNEEELATLSPVPILGSINGAGPQRAESPFVVEADPDSSAAAAYRLLATKIELSNGDKAPRSVLILDAPDGHSGSALAANLAGALAEGGTRVALIHHGGEQDVEKLFGLSGNPAAEEKVRPGDPVRVDRITFDRFRIRHSRVTVFWPQAPAELLEPRQATEMLDRVLADMDAVVLTTPPVDSSPHSLVWSSTADATVLVAERDHTQREQVPAAVESLRLAGGNVIGVVLCRERAS
jgi:capsular polysaccharide biosynthesis protein